MLLLVFGVAAVLTFFLDGKQWPTAITVLPFGVLLGRSARGASLEHGLFVAAHWVSGLFN